MKQALRNLNPAYVANKLGVKFYVSTNNTAEKLEEKYTETVLKADAINNNDLQSAFMRRMQLASGALLGGTAVTLGASQSAFAAACGGGSQAQVVALIKNATKFILILISAASVLMLAWAAFLYVTSAGSSSRASKAKEAAKNVIIGFGLALAIFLIRSVIVDIVGNLGGGTGGTAGCLQDTKDIS